MGFGQTMDLMLLKRNRVRWKMMGIEQNIDLIWAKYK